VTLGVWRWGWRRSAGRDGFERPDQGRRQRQSQATLETIDAAGEPKQFQKGELTGFAVWHGKKRWHLRTTTKKAKHHFKGHIHVEGGTLESISSSHLEDKGKLEDHWKVNESGTRSPSTSRPTRAWTASTSR